MIYNGVDLSNILIVRKWTKGALPPQNAESIQVAGRAGAWFANKKDGIRIISVEATMLADSLVEAYQKFDDLAETLNVSEPVELTRKSQPERYYMALVIGDVTEVQVGSDYEFSITFACFDPYAYSLVADIYNSAIGANIVTANNGGAIETPLKIKAAVNSNTAGFRVSLGTEFIYIDKFLLSGDEIEIDNETHKATINGVNVPITFESSWLMAPVGGFTLESAQDVTLSVTLRKRWL